METGGTKRSSSRSECTRCRGKLKLCLFCNVSVCPVCRLGMEKPCPNGDEHEFEGACGDPFDRRGEEYSPRGNGLEKRNSPSYTRGTYEDSPKRQFRSPESSRILSKSSDRLPKGDPFSKPISPPGKPAARLNEQISPRQDPIIGECVPKLNPNSSSPLRDTNPEGSSPRNTNPDAPSPRNAFAVSYSFSKSSSPKKRVPEVPQESTPKKNRHKRNLSLDHEIRKRMENKPKKEEKLFPNTMKGESFKRKTYLGSLFKDGASMTDLIEVLLSMEGSDDLLSLLLSLPLFSEPKKFLSKMLKTVTVLQAASFEKIINEWITTYPEDWTPPMCQKLRTFIEINEKFPLQRSKLLEFCKGQMDSDRGVPNPGRSFDWRPIARTREFGCLKWDLQTTAEQLRFAHFKMLSSIPLREYLSWLESKSKKTECPAIYDMTTHFNQLVMWVVSEIVSQIRRPQRIELVQRFIQLAHLSLKMNDFFAAKAIFSGISHPAVSRMKNTLSGLSREAKNRLSSLQEVLIDGDTGGHYRLLLQKANAPYIPFLGLHFKDMTFIQNGSLTLIGELINVSKVLTLGDSVMIFKRGYSQPCVVEPIEEIQKWIRDCPAFSDDELIQWSKRAEPSDVDKLIEEFIWQETSLKDALRGKDQALKERENEVQILTNENRNISEFSLRLQDQLGRFKDQIQEANREKKEFESKFLDQLHERDVMIEQLRKKINQLEENSTSRKLTTTSSVVTLPSARKKKFGECSRCSSTTSSVRRCSNCFQSFCVPCQQLKRLKNPCSDGMDHQFIVSQVKETKGSGKKESKGKGLGLGSEVNCANCSTITLAFTECSACSLPYCRSCQKLNALGMLACPKGKEHKLKGPEKSSTTTKSSETTKGTPQLRKKTRKSKSRDRSCKRCGSVSGTKSCKACRLPYCSECQKIETSRNPCVNGSKHKFERVEKCCDRCSSTTLLEQCQTCQKLFCAKCRAMMKGDTNQPNCHHCLNQMENGVRCLFCAYLFCTSCQKLNSMGMLPCSKGSPHNFSEKGNNVDRCTGGSTHSFEEKSCDRCSSDVPPRVNCEVCNQSYCVDCRKLKRLKNPCSNGMDHVFPKEKEKEKGKFSEFMKTESSVFPGERECERCCVEWDSTFEDCLLCDQSYCENCQSLDHAENPCAANSQKTHNFPNQKSKHETTDCQNCEKNGDCRKCGSCGLLFCGRCEKLSSMGIIECGDGGMHNFSTVPSPKPTRSPQSGAIVSSKSVSPTLPRPGAQTVSPTISRTVSPVISQTTSSTISPATSPTVSPAVSPIISRTVSPVISPRASPTISRASPNISRAVSPVISQTASPIIPQPATPTLSPRSSSGSLPSSPSLPPHPLSECSNCSKRADTCLLCCKCDELFCGSCCKLSLMGILECLDAKPHDFSKNEEQKEKIEEKKPNSPCYNCKQDAGATKCRLCNSSLCESCQKLANMGFLECANERPHEFGGAPAGKMKPTCHHCRIQIDDVSKQCSFCRFFFCASCQKLSVMGILECTTNVEHHFEGF